MLTTIALLSLTSTSLAIAQPRADAPATDRLPAPGTIATAAREGQERGGGMTHSLEFNADHAFRADLSDGPGSVAVTRAGVGLDLGYSLAPKVVLSLQLAAEASWYDFKDAPQVIPTTSKPFSQMFELVARPTLVIIQDRTWSYIIGGQITAGGETDADVGDSITGGAFGGVSYRVNEAFSFTLGAGFSTRLEKATTFVPFIGFDWKIDDRTRLSSRGPGLRLSHTLTDELTFVLDAVYQSREFRLADEPPLAEGVVRDRRIPVTAGVIWMPAGADGRLSATFKAGAVAWQEFEVYNNLGNTISETNARATPFVSIGLDWKF
jgi:hypothetical protein